MEALKAGIEKTKEAIDARKAEEKFQKANDPNLKLDDRIHARNEAEKAVAKAAEHHDKAEIHHAKHVAK